MPWEKLRGFSRAFSFIIRFGLRLPQFTAARVELVGGEHYQANLILSRAGQAVRLIHEMRTDQPDVIIVTDLDDFTLGEIDPKCRIFAALGGDGARYAASFAGVVQNERSLLQAIISIKLAGEPVARIMKLPTRSSLLLLRSWMALLALPASASSISTDHVPWDRWSTIRCLPQRSPQRGAQR
jgi:hypothetical protein